MIDAHIVGTAVMPILQLLDLICCFKACDAKPVVKLGDWMVQIFLAVLIFLQCIEHYFDLFCADAVKVVSLHDTT